MSSTPIIKYYNANDVDEELTIEQGVFEPSDSDIHTLHQFGQFHEESAQCQACDYKKLCFAFSMLGLGQEELSEAGTILEGGEANIVERKSLIDAEYDSDYIWRVTSGSSPKSLAYGIVESLYEYQEEHKNDDDYALYFYTYSMYLDAFPENEKGYHYKSNFYEGYEVEIIQDIVNEGNDDEYIDYYIHIVNEGSQSEEYLQGESGDRIKFSLSARKFK